MAGDVQEIDDAIARDKRIGEKFLFPRARVRRGDPKGRFGVDPLLRADPLRPLGGFTWVSRNERLSGGSFAGSNQIG